MLLKVRSDFDSLSKKVNGKDLIYFDSAATTLKPNRVVEAIEDYYKNHNSNVHRSPHTLAGEATTMYEDARDAVANFINAKREEVIFTKGTTESLNSLAYSLSKDLNGEVLISTLEHHANFVPWQQLFDNVIYYDAENGVFNEEKYLKLVNKNTSLISITGQSNVTGQEINIKNLVLKIRKINKDVIIVLDGAQLIPHSKIDVKELDIDFLAFSGHKMLGPMGIGVLYGKKYILEKMKPFLYGGEMIDQVSIEKTTFNVLPYKFEAGTPNVGGAIGLAEAIKYLESLNVNEVYSHIKELTSYAIKKLSELDFLDVYGTKDTNHNSLISFNVKNVHPHDVANLLNDLYGIAIRSGHHCAQPLMKNLNVHSTCRASFYIYNTLEEIDVLIEGLKKVNKILG
ncbi:putative cysteine desulfurase [Tepiditoga spiralis]|uniref:Cysteine desulfurase n=1 Tax=Tepiditoga spiralis TaxID=2108365 RepID=A0A7G1G3D4_9BACT|nr:SufS family cysteine desulfurase [Tepiditoga spiralis]BBE30515.1 putative cysteine desulfurase [Tepiditoga spiralis]